jgi:hypothetical protein
MRYLLSIFIFLSINSYAQESTDSASVSSPVLNEEEIINTTPEDNPTSSFPIVKEENIISSSEDDNSSEIIPDKNLGKVFDGASVSFSLGTNNYFGDLAAYSFLPRTDQLKQYLTPGFKLSIARDIKWGLGAELSYQRGRLIGTRKTGKNSSQISFRNQFFNLALQVKYDLGAVLFKKKTETRLKLYSNFGLGYMWYRTQLFDSETLNTKDFEGYIESDNTISTAQKVLSDKTPKAKAFTIPYGIILTYKISHKVDVHFDLTQTSTFTDRLDAFNRSWTAKDKYNYTGIGLTYNFNRTLDDAPKKRQKKNKPTKEKVENVSEAPVNKIGLFGSNKKKAKEDDELLNIRLKLFETQLKLFEMQYLIGK